MLTMAVKNPNKITPDYVVPERFMNEPRPFRVVCMGAGASGINMVYKMKLALPKIELTVYEKNSDIGGTWWENKYPGCACDSKNP